MRPVAVARLELRRDAAPAAAAQGAHVALRGDERIEATFAREVGVLLKAVKAPLPDVAGEVMAAERADARGVSADVARAAGVPVLSKVRVGFVGFFVAPGVGARLGAARGELPLGLGGERAAGPCAEGEGVIPADTGDGERWGGEAFGLPWGGRGGAGRFNEALVFGVRHGEHADRKRGERDRVPRVRDVALDEV